MSQNLFDLSGRVAVVAGGTTGIGHAIALGLAQAGADVVASSRRAEQVEKAASEIEGLGRKSLRVTSDVLDRGSLEKLHDEVIKGFGKIDILVNAAGVTYKAPTLEMYGCLSAICPPEACSAAIVPAVSGKQRGAAHAATH